MKIVIGLGNPGRKYENTRHNVGFRVADALAARRAVDFRRSWRSRALIASFRLDTEEVKVVKPLTYMNNSGTCVVAVLRKYGLLPRDLIVVFDDVELDCGEVRIRKQGGAGGHNGMESVISHLGTKDFVRVRVGIGPRPPGEQLVDYVLGHFTVAESAKVGPAVERAADAVERIVAAGPDHAMNEFNRKNE